MRDLADVRGLRTGAFANKDEIELLVPEYPRIPAAVHDDVEPAAIREEEGRIDRLCRRGLYPDNVETTEIPDVVSRRRVCPVNSSPVCAPPDPRGRDSERPHLARECEGWVGELSGKDTQREKRGQRLYESVHNCGHSTMMLPSWPSEHRRTSSIASDGSTLRTRAGRQIRNHRTATGKTHRPSHPEAGDRPRY